MQLQQLVLLRGAFGYLMRVRFRKGAIAIADYCLIRASY
jgi:hypothetical protein